MNQSLHPGLEYFKYLIHCQRKIFNQTIPIHVNPDKLKKDCSWLALIEDVLDLNNDMKVGERVYYYNFYTHSRSLFQPEEVKLQETEYYQQES